MKLFLLKFLRSIRVVRYDVLSTKIENFPDMASYGNDRLVIVEDAGVQKWACLNCPGGCGKAINLSLNPHRRPQWAVTNDGLSRPSVSPSVHQKNECGCHFWIKKGVIQWCKNGYPKNTRH